MNYYKFKMSEEEFINYCESLSELELKQFQLESKKDDIKRAYRWLYVACITMILASSSANWAYKVVDSMFLTVTCVIITIVSLCFMYGLIRRIEQEKLMYKMLQVFYKENNIL